MIICGNHCHLSLRLTTIYRIWILNQKHVYSSICPTSQVIHNTEKEKENYKHELEKKKTGKFTQYEDITTALASTAPCTDQLSNIDKATTGGQFPLREKGWFLSLISSTIKMQVQKKHLLTNAGERMNSEKYHFPHQYNK